MDTKTDSAANDGPIVAIGAANKQIRRTQNDAVRSANNTTRIPGLAHAISISDAHACTRDFESGLAFDSHPRGLILVASNRLSAANRDYSLEGDGLRRLCQSVAAPFPYLHSLPPCLRSELLQYHVDRCHGSGSRRSHNSTTIISRDGRFLAFGRADLQMLTGSQILSAAAEAINENRYALQVSRIGFAQERMVFEIVGRQAVAEVRRGDVITAGIRVEHCYLGTQATTVHAFVLRLVCANGLTARECTGPRCTARTRRLPTQSENAAQRQIDQVRRLTSERWAHAQRVLDSVRRLREEQVANPSVVFERFLRTGRLYSQSLMKRLIEAWRSEDNEHTAFGVLNALTRVATHDTNLSDRQRRALAALAGIFAQKNTHICPHCFSVLPRTR
jgi:hypothetical protein